MSGMAREAGRVLLVVCGGIAAYKACEVLRRLQKAGVDVRVVMTDDARRFVGETTFEALSGHPVPLDFYEGSTSPIPHIELSGWADLALVVPATANVIAKMATGIADDLASTTLLASSCPIVVAPAMNTRMWANPATQANVATLSSRGVSFVLPEEGRLACGEEGAGKLAAVGEIVDHALGALGHGSSSGQGTCDGKGGGDLAGRSVVITAGPTHEAIDPVRFIANASTGKMGYTIAAEAARRGARVTIVSGPVSIDAPEGCGVVRVTSAREMHQAALVAFDDADAAICTAAVADFRPAAYATHKLKKGTDSLEVLTLVENPDILADLSARKDGRVVIGFAAETDDLIPNAQAKLVRKGCDLIVANDVSRADSTFGADTSRISFVSGEGVEQLETMPLDEVARSICDRLRAMLPEPAARA